MGDQLVPAQVLDFRLRVDDVNLVQAEALVIWIIDLREVASEGRLSRSVLRPFTILRTESFQIYELANFDCICRNLILIKDCGLDWSECFDAEESEVSDFKGLINIDGELDGVFIVFVVNCILREDNLKREVVYLVRLTAGIIFTWRDVDLEVARAWRSSVS